MSSCSDNSRSSLSGWEAVNGLEEHPKLLTAPVQLSKSPYEDLTMPFEVNCTTVNILVSISAVKANEQVWIQTFNFFNFNFLSLRKANLMR